MQVSTPPSISSFSSKLPSYIILKEETTRDIETLTEYIECILKAARYDTGDPYESVDIPTEQVIVYYTGSMNKQPWYVEVKNDESGNLTSNYHEGNFVADEHNGTKIIQAMTGSD